MELQSPPMTPLRRAASAALLSALLHPAVASTDEVAPDAAQVRSAVRAWLRQNERAVLRDFASLLSIPNVASNVADIERNAFAIERRLRTRGFETRRLGDPGEPPVLFAERHTPGARRTIVIYVHYDGQPVDPARWAS